MDPLDEVFSAMHVESALYARLEATAPWGLKTRRVDTTTRFGLMLRGSCWLTLDDPEFAHEPIALVAGDCFVIPRGLAYTLRDHMKSPTVNCVDVVRANLGGVVTLGGAASRAPSSAAGSRSIRTAHAPCSTCCRRCCISAWTRAARNCCRPRCSCLRWKRHSSGSVRG